MSSCQSDPDLPSKALRRQNKRQDSCPRKGARLWATRGARATGVGARPGLAWPGGPVPEPLPPFAAWKCGIPHGQISFVLGKLDSAFSWGDAHV